MKPISRVMWAGLYCFCFAASLLSWSCGRGGSTLPAAEITMLTPYKNSDDMSGIHRTFSADASAPWGVAHNGLDFFPSGDLKPFQAVCSGVIEEVRLWKNPVVSTWQVNVRIKYNKTYSVEYAFEPFSTDSLDGETQLRNIFVSRGQAVSPGSIIGNLHIAGSAAHVHFTLMKNWEGICPEPYFTREAKESILNLIRRDHPDWNICY